MLHRRRDRYPLDESLLAASPVHIKREDPLVVASLKLGKMLTKTGATIDFDCSKIAEIIRQALPEDEMKRTTVTFTTPKLFSDGGGHYRSAMTEQQVILHNLDIFITPYMLKHDGTYTGTILAHEAQHAKDISRLGIIESNRTYHAHNARVTTATSAALFVPSIFIDMPALSEGHPSPLALLAGVTALVCGPYLGHILGYHTNPYEKRARHAQTSQPKESTIITVNQ